MNEDDLAGKQTSGITKQSRALPYTTKDFQLEVLGQLTEMQALTQALQESIKSERKASQEQERLLRFDGRTLVAIGAIALSLTGYMLQDARNSSKRDAEIETTKARVTTLEGIAAANTEARIKNQVELGELRKGQAEIKELIQAHDRASRKVLPQKQALMDGEGHERE
jgi:hypothetical protein